jgi:hypothetical protein
MNSWLRLKFHICLIEKHHSFWELYMVQYYILYIALSHYLYYSEQKKTQDGKKKREPKVRVRAEFLFEKEVRWRRQEESGVWREWYRKGARSNISVHSTVGDEPWSGYVWGRGSFWFKEYRTRVEMWWHEMHYCWQKRVGLGPGSLLYYQSSLTDRLFPINHKCLLRQLFSK